MKHWGKNTEVLNECPGLLHPKKSATAAMGPIGSYGGSTGSTAGTITDLEQPVWDKCDIRLFFLGELTCSKEETCQEGVEVK